ncbi:MAG: hypothetical protein HPY66_1729 [Firmicutes bacterium]|nr:hypothetical protein [Bacillota bacterium]
MSQTDTVFTAYHEERNLTITLLEGNLYFGKAHIISRRPDMAKRIDAVKYAIENHDIAYKDKDHGNRERIYCLGADSTRSSLYMAVVVEYNSVTNGTIITAWPSDKMVGGGDIVYTKSES